MLLVSDRHDRGIRDHEAGVERSEDDEALKEYKRIHRYAQAKCVIVTICCLAFGITAIVMEAFAALTVQFCYPEDLSFLYWSFWTLVQVGSVIAIFGITAAQVYSWVTDSQAPPWNVALGTPVLVIAGLCHMMDSAIRKKIDNWRGRDQTDGLPLSLSSTLQSKYVFFLPLRSKATVLTICSRRCSMKMQTITTVQSQSASLLGFTTNNSPLIEFGAAPSSLPKGARLIGFIGNGRPLIQFEPVCCQSAGTSTQPASSEPAPEKPEPVRQTSLRSQRDVRFAEQHLRHASDEGVGSASLSSEIEDRNQAQKNS